MNPDSPTLYVVSCRKPDPRSREPRAFQTNAREVYLNTPKRAGTYVLIRAPVDAQIPDDLVLQVALDTDAGEGPDRARTPEQQEPWRSHQRATEDLIANQLWALGPLVLYVHGYNTKPGEALRAGARIQGFLDSNKVGAKVVVFAWPSAGHLADYFPDQRAAGQFGSYALINLLMSLRRAPGGTGSLHCIAHSMGTYVVTRALSTIATLHMEASLPQRHDILTEVAFMQPDIDYDILCSGYLGPADGSSYDSPSYLEIADGYGATEMMGRLTVYCSTNDVALFASLFENRTKRLGAYGPGLERDGDARSVMSTRVRKNVDVVNCDDWCVFDVFPRHSHSHFLDCPRMMADVARALGGQPATANRDLAAFKAPRWYRLQYQPAPRILRVMASFWGSIGTFAVNPVVVFLVKWKKRLQTYARIAQGVVPVVSAGATGVLAWLTNNPVWQVAFVVSAGGIVLYVPIWLRARAIQKREDV